MTRSGRAIGRMKQGCAGRFSPQTNGSTILHTSEPVQRAAKHLAEEFKLALIGRKLEYEGKSGVILRHTHLPDESSPASQRPANTTADFRTVMHATVLPVLKAPDAGLEGARSSQHLVLQPLYSMDAP